ncbi:L,D-transpeptidase [Actinomycetospora soli]|uniref:L,D-transpeptidase n=1 Tax=Actinomycetospora soli TaxID=2893887 RepID=UPI001E52E71F|nr:L,D-transpeptidase [Actinomycetospora soli]MCD2191531.1 L,D-transpeptidase [Actinomycetospora soli]
MSKHRAVSRPHHRRFIALSSGVAAAGLAIVPLTGVATAAPAPSPTAPAGQMASMPCSDQVQACVRLSTNEAWLADGAGNVVRGPIAINHGGPGNETPTGRFSVQWKDADHRSSEYNGAPMPWSVFFDGNGRAFHGGNAGKQTAGCVRLPDEQAKAFFEALNPGDAVQILP